jgi:hypothetical protein
MATTQKGYATASALVFALVAIVQVLRALRAWPVQIDGVTVPVMASWGVAVFAALMAGWGWRSR